MLPNGFLAQMARDHELSREQEEVFLLRYGQELGYNEIAKRLKTSEGACLKRMGQVYNKFNVSGSSRGKETRLRNSLIKQFQQIAAQKPSTPKDTSPPTPLLQGGGSNNSSPSIPLKLGEESNNSSPLIPLKLGEGSNNSSPLIPLKLGKGSNNSSPPSHAGKGVGGLGLRYIYENLPRRECTTFIGRRQQLARLLKLLSPEKATNLISVDGVGGVGKTTLVLEAAHMSLQASIMQTTSQVQDFEGTTIPCFEAIIFTSAKKQYLKALQILPRLRREHNLRDIYRTIAHTLERPEIGYRSLEDQLELILDCLRCQRTLLIVDNLETIEDKQDVLSFLYELPPTVKVVITSREQALFVPIRLESLSQEEAMRLIQHQAEEKELQLVPFETELLYQNTHGIPAAIVYTIGQLSAGYSLADVLKKLKSATGDVARFCFESSVERLRGEPSHRILMTLSLFPQPVDRETIAAITLEDSINTGDGLAQLQQLSLVRQQDARYNLHPLTREYAAYELSNHHEFEQEVRNRWVDWYLQFSKKYGNVDEKKWFTSQQNYIKTEWENLQEVINWCITKYRYKDILTLWQQIKGYAHVRGLWDKRQEWSNWLRQTAEIESDWSTVAELSCDQGWTLTLTRQPESLKEASILLQRAWELRDHKDINFQLELAHRLTGHSIHQNKFEEANKWLKIKQDMLKQPGVSELEGQRQPIQTLYYQGKMLFINGDYAKAKKLYQKALQQAEKIAWHRIATLIRNWLADIAIKENDLQVAQQILDQGLRLAELNEDIHSIAFHQRSFAYLFQQQGNLKLANDWAVKAAESFESLGMMPEARQMQALLQQE